MFLNGPTVVWKKMREVKSFAVDLGNIRRTIAAVPRSTFTIRNFSTIDVGF